jgi:hypothetical protein
VKKELERSREYGGPGKGICVPDCNSRKPSYDALMSLSHIPLPNQLYFPERSNSCCTRLSMSSSFYIPQLVPSVGLVHYTYLDYLHFGLLNHLC